MALLRLILIGAALVGWAASAAAEHGQHAHSQHMSTQCCGQTVEGHLVDVLVDPSHDTIRRIQAELGVRGYYHGVVDGIVGPQTRTAIGAFQTSEGLPHDGLITGETLRRLGLNVRSSIRTHQEVAGGPTTTRIVRRVRSHGEHASPHILESEDHHGQTIIRRQVVTSGCGTSTCCQPVQHRVIHHAPGHSCGCHGQASRHHSERVVRYVRSSDLTGGVGQNVVVHTRPRTVARRRVYVHPNSGGQMLNWSGKVH